MRYPADQDTYVIVGIQSLHPSGTVGESLIQRVEIKEPLDSRTEDGYYVVFDVAAQLTKAIDLGKNTRIVTYLGRCYPDRLVFVLLKKRIFIIIRLGWGLVQLFLCLTSLLVLHYVSADRLIDDTHTRTHARSSGTLH